MIWHDVEQNSEEWELLRLGKATASNFGLIMANEGGHLASLRSAMHCRLHWSRLKGANLNSPIPMSIWSVVMNRSQ